MTTVTAEELLKLPDNAMRHELVEGQLRVMPLACVAHGRVTSTASWLLGDHVHGTGIGVAVAAGTGFLLASDPDTARAPDVAFIRRDRVEAVGRTERFWPGPPDFAIEVVSPSGDDAPHDSRPEVHSKTLDWLAAGTLAVLVLDPTERTATVYRAPDDIRAYTDGEIDLSDAVPGWVVAVADFFA
jgi:Uma2 family endonuclease